MSASTYKYVQVKLTNTSDEIDVMNIRARVAGGTWTVFHQESITTDTMKLLKHTTSMLLMQDIQELLMNFKSFLKTLQIQY